MPLLYAIFISTLIFLTPHVNADQVHVVKKVKPKHLPQKKIEHIEVSPNQYDHQNDDDWANIIHESIANSVYQTAYWFDSFFTLDENDQKPPKTSIKIRLGWQPKRTSLRKINARFRIKLSLPNLKNKADLILSDDSEDKLADLPLETINSPQTLSQDSFTAALRFVHKRDKNQFTDSRVGISGKDIFYRLRHKRRYSWLNDQSLKIEPAFYYFVQDGFGARLFIEYNYQVVDTEQYRLNYSVRASESFMGLKYKYAAYHLKQLSDQRASVFGIVIEGLYNSEEGNYIEKYKISYRYRFNAFRRWLFFEVEPFTEWTKEDAYTTNPGIALRVEGFFQKN